jgi:signal recognition particle subunit SRP54
MFESLTQRLSGIFDRLRGRGALSESDVDAALREVRVALLEADVALAVVQDFIAKVRASAVGEQVLRSVTPGQMVIKIVHDRLVEMLGGSAEEVATTVAPPAIVMLVGLQGSGKTTTAAKLGLRLRTLGRKKILLAGLDVQRPAAQEQLARLGVQANLETLAIVAGQGPIQIARRAAEAARLGGYDALILDTAGRLAIDEELMAQARAVRDATLPHEVLLVADAMTGQDAVNLARAFQAKVGLTGIVLTRMEGDARGGAALSMRAVTGCPIKLVGVGEKLDALEPFHPDRVAGRILGMGDVVSLVEKAAQTVERDDAAALAAKFEAGRFDLDDFASQLRQMRKMGGMAGLLDHLPGIAKAKAQLAGVKLDDGVLLRQEAIILSMTREERRKPDIIKASRKQRIAAGSGTSVNEVNRLLKQFLQAQDMMKRMRKLGQKGLMRHGVQSLFRQ